MVLACLFFCLTSKAKFNITSSNSKNIHNQQLAEFVCNSSCWGGLRAFTNMSDLMTHKMPKVEWYQLHGVFFCTCNKKSVQSCWKMTSCTHLRKHDPQSNSHGYSMFNTLCSHNTDVFALEACGRFTRASCFASCACRKHHVISSCVNGTFECIPYKSVEHVLRAYLTVNAVFVSSVRPFQKAKLLKLLGSTWSAVLPLH